MELIPHSLTPELRQYGIRSLIVIGTPVGARKQSVLYPRTLSYSRLALKLFRREPAITEFDWPFTPYHRSSKRFSARNGSVLHSVLPEVQPAHGKITQLRVYVIQLVALLTLAFASASFQT